MFTGTTENKVHSASDEIALHKLTTKVADQLMPKTPARIKSSLLVREGASTVLGKTVDLKQRFNKLLPPTELLALIDGGKDEANVEELKTQHLQIMAVCLEKTGDAVLGLSEFVQKLAKEHKGSISAFESLLEGLCSLISILKGAIGNKGPDFVGGNPIPFGDHFKWSPRGSSAFKIWSSPWL